jgi:outer membrane protein assembly factor BamB
VAKQAREAVEALKLRREAKAREDAAKAVEEKAKRIQEFEAAGKNAPEKELEKTLQALKALAAELDATAAACHPSLRESVDAARAQARGALERLEGRLQELVYLRAAISWERGYGDVESVRATLRRAAENGPRQEIRDKAREMDAGIVRYLEEAETAFRRGTEALEKAKLSAGDARDGLFEEALVLLKIVALDHPRSPLAPGVQLPIWIETTPEGAAVRVEGRAEEARTPALLLYGPKEGLRMLVERPGFIPVPVEANASAAVVRLLLRRQFLWTTRMADAVDRGPAVAGGRAFVGCHDGGLYAVSFEGGKPVRAWPPFRVDDIGGVKATPTVWDDRVVFCPANLTRVHALQAGSGEPAWDPLPTERPVNHAAVGVEGTPLLLVGDLGGTLYAVNGKTGKLSWKLAVGEEGEGVRSPPAVFPARGWAFVGTSRGALVKVDFRNGQKVWRVPTGLAVNVSPVAAGDLVLVAVGSRLVAYDPTPREPPAAPRWSASMLTEVSPPAVLRGLAHVTERGGSYRVIRLVDGKETLTAALANLSTAPVTPVPLERNVVVAHGNVLYALDVRSAKAEVLWTLEAPGPINDPVVARDGVVYLTTSAGDLCATLTD